MIFKIYVHNLTVHCLFIKFLMKKTNPLNQHNIDLFTLKPQINIIREVNVLKKRCSDIQAHWKIFMTWSEGNLQAKRRLELHQDNNSIYTYWKHPHYLKWSFRHICRQKNSDWDFDYYFFKSTNCSTRMNIVMTGNCAPNNWLP